ncbi:MAG: endonuclease V [Bernardetiaceae bacterium]|jgi:exodeoxyribonuclease-5/deoxyribonuclease V|nr:endonuclease V [Bernardetiaceae bacterium]
MILAFDTYYFENKARTVCISFENWSDEANYQVDTEITEGVAEYQSGEFYKRELPCIVSLYSKIETKDVEAIIVDGYVYLNDSDKLGLGGHLYHQLNGRIPIIGVAKTNFATLENNKRHLLRGESRKPLYITAIGIDIEEATKLIGRMSGGYRIPTLLKLLDTLTKTNH